MVVDDSPLVRRQAARALGLAHFTVSEARDGIEALGALKAGPTVALIVCDVNMPRMGGLGLLAAMREDPRLRSIPVLILTLPGEPELLRRARALGAKAWAFKPFTADSLVAAVECIVSGIQRDAAAHRIHQPG
jgi:CheY-like chemotaxis protein